VVGSDDDKEAPSIWCEGQRLEEEVAEEEVVVVASADEVSGSDTGDCDCTCDCSLSTASVASTGETQ
jgi:hypothetical protein